MSRGPVIGLVTQTQEAIAGKTPRVWIMGQRYVRVLTSLGAVPWIIPLLPDDEETSRAIDAHLDGLFLIGGVDMDPSAYGQAREHACGQSDPDRDAIELQMLRWALQAHKPVLGVCRGIQVINVGCGGTLYQDLPSQRTQSIKHDYFPPAEGYERHTLVHPVRVRQGSRLAQIMGVEETTVNSMHHQAIRELGAGLQPTALAPDGLIEGIEGTNGQFLIGVQWHPEELVESQTEMLRLFEAFVAAARQFQKRSTQSLVH